MAKYRITSIPQTKYPTGGTVSQRWEQITGTPWAEAKAKGLTTGSFEDNIALLKRLNSGEFNLSNDITKNVSVSDPAPNPVQPIDPTTLSKIKNAQTFNQAFTIARSAMGSNQIFEWNGRKYGTNLKGETFNPSNEVLKAAGMNTPKVKERLQKENNQLNSPFISKSTVKLQPDPYQDWEEIKKKNAELNKKNNADKIISYKKKNLGDKNFVIVDKQKGLLHIYDPKGIQLFSSAIDLGAQSSDAQTVTKYKDLNKDGKILGNEINKHNVDWSAGNLSTGAGKFYISNIDKTGYQGLPILNMMNELQYENYLKTGKVENVSTSFHKGYVKDDNSRVSNGCIRCNKTTLDNLTKYLQNSSEVYILPEDKGNEFVYENGKLNFRVNPQHDYNTYTDQTGKTQKGQGVNRGQNTLNYVPIKLKFDEDKFRDEIFTAMDWDDEDELVNTKKFISGLQDQKQDIMKAAKINGDVYNEIAKMVFGIYGTESHYGDTHSGVTNVVRAANKYFDPKNASSPDYDSKYNFYGADEEFRSVGFTQLRWNEVNDDEKKALKEVGITSNADFMNPTAAAVGTAVILGVRYNQQLTADEKKDIWKYLPFKWNIRGNYADRVKENSRFVSVYQYTGSDKPKTSTSKTTSKPVKEYTPIYGSTISGRDQYHPKLNPSPASSTYVKPYVSPYNMPPMLKSRKFEEGGFIETDLPKEAIQDYVNHGYIVEEVPQYPTGGIFRRRKRQSSLDYPSWSDTNPEIIQPGEDPFELPIYPSGPAAEFEQPEFMFPDWTPEQIDAYYREKEAYDAKMARKNAYAPEALTYKNLARPKGYFVLAEDMPKTFLKELKDNGFYAKKTETGDYEVFSNKDIADLIYKKGLNPNELSTKLDLGSAKELKSYFDPIYQNASMIHAKRNKEKIDRLIKQGYDKDAAIAKLVRDGEGTTTELNNLYGAYTKSAYDKKEAEAKALIAAGAPDPDKLTDYQKQMYLNIKNYIDTQYEENVKPAYDEVSSWGNWDITPAESTAFRNNASYVNPITGKYEKADNRTAYEKNEDAKVLAEQALSNYNALYVPQAGAARKIIGSENLTDEQRKKFLENPEDFNKILKEYVDWSNAPEGQMDPRPAQYSGEYHYTPGNLKSEFNVTPEGARWIPGNYGSGRYVDGPVEMLYPEKYFMGPGLGVTGLGFKGLTRALEYAPISAAPWLTAGNALNAYMGYETVKPGGLISQSIEGFKEDDKLKGWGNAGLSALNLLPFVGPTVKGVKYLNSLGKVDDAAQFEGVTQAGIGSWFKPSPGASSVVDDVTLKNLKANNYQGASDDVITKILEKGRAESQQGFWNSTMTPEEQMILKANEVRAKELASSMGPVQAAPKTPATGFVGKTKEKIVGASTKAGEAVTKPAQNWWANTKSHFQNSNWLESMSPFQISKSTTGVKNTTEAATTAVQTTGKYQSMDEIAQSMYGSKFDDLSSLAKSQVDKAFKAQPLPSGASTSSQGIASTTTNASDDILLKNKISQQKYGQDYDQVSSWAQSAVDKEFQAAKTLQQEAAATNQAQNTANANINATGTEASNVQFTAPPRFEHSRVGESLQGLYQRGKYWDEAGAKGDDLLNSDMINYHGTYSGRPIVEVKMPDGSSEFFYKSTGWAGKESNKGIFGKRTTEGAWQPFGGFSNTPTTKNWFIKDAGYKDYYGSNTFKSMAENLDNALVKKFGMKNTKELDNAINFQNRFGNIDSYTPMAFGAVGTAAAFGDDDNSNLMLAGLPLALMSKGKLKLDPNKVKYLKVATAAANEVNPLNTSAVLSADANNIKSFIEGNAFNKGLTGASKQTEGAFNMGVFNVKNDPNFIIKLENPALVGAQRAMPEYQNINMAEAMQNISGPTFGKVHHQVVSPNTGNRALILNKLEGAPYNELTMDDFLNLSDDAIVKFHEDVQTLKRNNLGFDFTGNNYMFDRNTNQFKLFDIDPHMTQFDPNHQHVYDFFQNIVYGGGNPMLFGYKQAGLNLQKALKDRLGRDLILKMSDAGVSNTDRIGIKNVYDQRLDHLFRGLNYEKDGGSIEMDVNPDMVEALLAQGYNVEQM